MTDGPHYIIQPGAKRKPFALHTNPFMDPDAHLSLGEVNRYEALRLYRTKLAKSGLKLSAEDFALWVKLNRVPRRLPIYRLPTRPKGAA
jgi:hypothetical protein